MGFGRLVQGQSGAITEVIHPLQDIWTSDEQAKVMI